MAMRVIDGARRDALVSRVSRLRRSRARALPSLNLKKKKDCSQWFGSHFNVGVTLRLLLSARVSSLVITVEPRYFEVPREMKKSSK